MTRDQRLINEMIFRTSRSSGKGGQNVNKVETRVEALLNVSESEALNDSEKHLLAVRLRNRISKEGMLAVTCQESRSQVRNKQLAVETMLHLINRALIVQKRRVATKMSKGANRERVKEKRQLGEKKARRKFSPPSD
ncbi:MAG: aminoacyl-tRNA hydrolase [Flavobacteriales bacterium]|nr:aminoacyl-tRNA hydrolase [Flavobacteriales bacterium]